MAGETKKAAEDKAIVFVDDCPELANTELYKQLKAKAGDDSAFLYAVEKVCYDGVVLSKDVIRFFPTFTLHDGTHIRGVCRWMERLLGDRINDLTAEQAAMLLLAACWHDSGMCVSDTQRKQFEEELRAEERPEDWKQYFRRHPGDEVAYSESGKLSEAMLRRFIRENHPARACGTMGEWPRALVRHGLQKDALVALCRSHGEKLERSYGTAANCDLNLCAVLLRLADALNYDASRTPDILFHQLGLDEPETAEQAHSRESWRRTGAGDFGEIDGRVIPYTARFEDPQLEHNVVSYLNWLQGELLTCSEFLASFAGDWRGLQLPQKISQNISREGYKAGDFHLTMDQDRVLELLTGRALYSDPGVFVRELLQNAIDAVLMRRRVDRGFGEKEGKIVIRSWTEGGECWFRIEDNGVGMDEHILMDYFLKVGRSYYTSDEFRAALLHEARNTGFHPISRFGIGVLSCFMGDPNNTLEVETRRYRGEAGGANPVLRLRVTGLHGYYFLTEPTRDQPGEKLHRPETQSCGADGYLRGVGTTVCTRINLYDLGGRTVRELLDRYLCFPEVKVEYYGPEGYESYPTQDEFLEYVHKLSGEDPAEPTPQVHPLPDKLFETLKQKLPGVRWSEKPALALRYYALDRLLGTESVLGVAIRAELQVHAALDPVCIDGETYELEIDTSAERKSGTDTDALSFGVKTSNSSLSEKGRAIDRLLDAKYNLLRQKYPDDGLVEGVFFHSGAIDDIDEYIRWHSLRGNMTAELGRELKEFWELAKSNRLYGKDLRNCSLTLSSAELAALLSGEERWLLSRLRRQREILRAAREDRRAPLTVTAYNGVLADTENLLGVHGSYLCVALLLRGERAPEVNLARDSIRALPLDLACGLSVAMDLLPGLNYPYNGTPEAMELTRFITVPTAAYWELLERRPHWEEKLKAGKDGDELSLPELERRLREVAADEAAIIVPDFHRTLADLFLLSALRRRFSLRKGTSNMYDPKLMGKRDEPELSGFPPCLFFHPEREGAPFGKVYTLLINYYNLEHPFSRWLIERRESLQEKAPGQYQRILKAMILGENADAIRTELNDTLSYLRSVSGNPFAVPAGLELKESDFN